MAAARTSASATGFTIIELVIVMALMTSVAAICLAWVPRLSEVMQADADLMTLSGQVTLAREAATSQRRAVELQFIAPNQIRVVRQDLPNGTTVLSQATLQHGAAFLRFADEPDTPDGFGGDQAINLGGAARVLFSADGLLTDETGNPVNITVFVEQDSRPMTARALTVFGPTARVRSYRWNGAAWRQ